MAGERGAAPTDDGWRRLDRRMLLVHPVHEVISYLPALLGIVLVGQVATDDGPWQIQAAFVVIPVAIGLLKWFTTSYRITPDQLQLRTGLAQKSLLTAPLDRVRTVDVSAPPLHRLLGLTRVKIGTGADRPFELNGLGSQQASVLRVELLHRSSVRAPTSATLSASKIPATAYSPGTHEVEIARLHPSWVRYAPFTTSGLLAAAAVFGFLGQASNRIIARVVESDAAAGIERHVESAGLFLVALEVAGVLLLILALLSVTSYVLAYWGYRLSRHEAGSLQISRGLLTSRATSLEERRIRGARLLQPLLLRLVGAAKATALTTGFHKAEESAGTANNLLIPPAPVGEAHRVVAAVLRTADPLDLPLVPHGPAARRRRYTRAFLGAGVLAAIAVAPVWFFELSRWLLLIAAAPVVAAPFLARDRYASLGHGVGSGYLVARSGSLPRARDMLLVSGIIGWRTQSTPFQRRVGLVTLIATTAAGGGAVIVHDVPAATAQDLMATLSGAYLRPFVTPSSAATYASATGRTR